MEGAVEREDVLEPVHFGAPEGVVEVPEPESLEDAPQSLCYVVLLEMQNRPSIVLRCFQLYVRAVNVNAHSSCAHNTSRTRVVRSLPAGRVLPSTSGKMWQGSVAAILAVGRRSQSSGSLQLQELESIMCVTMQRWSSLKRACSGSTLTNEST